MKSYLISEVIGVNPLGTTTVCAKFHGNPTVVEIFESGEIGIALQSHATDVASEIRSRFQNLKDVFRLWSNDVLLFFTVMLNT